MAGIATSWCWTVCHAWSTLSGCSFHCLQFGEPPAAHVVFQPFQQYGRAYSFGGSSKSHPVPPPSLQVGEGSSFPCSAPPSDIVNSESVVEGKPGVSGVVIRYQIDEFSHTWLAQHFIACSHIYHGFTVQVSTLTHFSLEHSCEHYSFLDKAIADFEQGLDSILTDPLTLQDWMHPLMRLMPFLLQSLPVSFTHVVLFLTLLNCSSLLTSNFISYDARTELYLFLFHRQGECELLGKLITFLVI